MILTGQVSSFRLQCFPYYVWCPKHGCLFFFFFSESIECLHGVTSKFFFKPFVTIPVGPVITGIITHFMLHIRCVSTHKLLCFYFLFYLLLRDISVCWCWHMSVCMFFSFLFLIIVSGLVILSLCVPLDSTALSHLHVQILFLCAYVCVCMCVCVWGGGVCGIVCQVCVVSMPSVQHIESIIIIIYPTLRVEPSPTTWWSTEWMSQCCSKPPSIGCVSAAS